MHPGSLASDLASASETASVGSFGAAPEDSSEMASADVPEVELGSISETGASSGKAILAETGEHRDPYLYPWRE